MNARAWSYLVGLAVVVCMMQGCAVAQNYDGGRRPIYIGRRLTQPIPDRLIRIVTFNIKFGEHIDKAADLLSHSGPLKGADILVVQETDSEGARRLSSALSMNYVYVPSAVHPSTRRDIGVALLSPWPVEDVADVPLPHLHRLRKIRRTAVAATVATPIGRVRVYGVHLETWVGASDRSRRDQAHAVLQNAAGWDGPLVIAGDFNGTGGPEELARSGFVWLTRNVHNTAWLFDFDHILVRGLCAGGDPAAARGPEARGISDHRPVWAVVQPCSGLKPSAS